MVADGSLVGTKELSAIQYVYARVSTQMLVEADA